MSSNPAVTTINTLYQVFAILGGVSFLLSALATVWFVIWYRSRKLDSEQWKDVAAIKEERIVDLERRVGDLEKRLIEEVAEKKRLAHENEELRGLNLRLQRGHA